MSTNSIEQLNTQIARLVREYLDAQQAVVTATVTRAFASAPAAPRPKPAKSAEAWGRRRPPTEVAGIAERLFDAVRANPGETMAVIAAQVGESARALHRPMHHLKQAGRVRSAGERHLTRYFPMTSKAA